MMTCFTFGLRIQWVKLPAFKFCIIIVLLHFYWRRRRRKNIYSGNFYIKLSVIRLSHFKLVFAHLHYTSELESCLWINNDNENLMSPISLFSFLSFPRPLLRYISFYPIHPTGVFTIEWKIAKFTGFFRLVSSTF